MLTSWSLKAFLVAWPHNQGGCSPSFSPTGTQPEKLKVLYIVEKITDLLILHIPIQCMLLGTGGLLSWAGSCCSLLTLICLDTKYQMTTCTPACRPQSWRPPSWSELAGGRWPAPAAVPVTAFFLHFLIVLCFFALFDCFMPSSWTGPPSPATCSLLAGRG